MSLLDNDFDINGEGLLIDTCIKYFEKHGYWGGSGYESFFPYNTSGFFDYDCYDNIIKNPKEYALYVASNLSDHVMDIKAVPRTGLQNKEILSRLCSVRYKNTNDYCEVTINDILNSLYEFA